MDEIPPEPPHPADDGPPPRPAVPAGQRACDDWSATTYDPARVAPSALLRDLGGAHQALQAELLAAYLDTLEWGGTVATDGMSPDDLLHLQAGVDRSTVGLLRTAAANRRRLPASVDATVHGVLTLQELAQVARTTSRVGRGAALARIDAEVARTAGRRAAGGAVEPGPVRLARWMVADVLHDPDRAAEDEDRELDRNRLVAQLTTDGRGRITADLDAEAITTVMGAVEAAAGPPRPDLPRPAQLAEGLLALASTSGSAPPRRPRLVATIDVADATAAVAGTLRAALVQDAPVLSARLADLLSDNAQLLVQVTDGRNPLAELKDADEVPAATRRAVRARDRGCRFPGCDAPEDWCDVHHLTPRAAGGTHEPTNLALGCRRHHRLVHRQRWRPRLDPRTASITWTRDNPDGTTTVLTSHPHDRRSTGNEVAAA